MLMQMLPIVMNMFGQQHGGRQPQPMPQMMQPLAGMVPMSPMQPQPFGGMGPMAPMPQPQPFGGMAPMPQGPQCSQTPQGFPQMPFGQMPQQPDGQATQGFPQMPFGQNPGQGGKMNMGPVMDMLGKMFNASDCDTFYED